MFHIQNRDHIFWPGMEVRDVHFRTMDTVPGGEEVIQTRSAFGRAVFIDPSRYKLQLYPFFDLINANFGNDRVKGVFSVADNVNLGVSVQNFMESISPKSPYHTISESHDYLGDIRKAIYASNTLQSNFVLSNGFLLQSRELICKPEKYQASGLDCDQFIPLKGKYSAFSFETGNSGIKDIEIWENRVVEPDRPPKRAISGPVLVRNGKNISEKIRYKKIPTGSNHVNYPPDKTNTSFTAFGLTEDQWFIMLSMFEDLRGQGVGVNLGISIYEIAELMVKELGAKEAILGGGGADTQQFLRGDHPQYMTAPVRTRAASQGERSEVPEARGLGAIVAVIPN